MGRRSIKGKPDCNNHHRQWLILLCFCIWIFPFRLTAQQPGKPMNIIFILADDHRYDAMGFMNKMQGLQTPGMDLMAKEGAHIKNAFVSTALCSPDMRTTLPIEANRLNNQVLVNYFEEEWEQYLAM